MESSIHAEERPDVSLSQHTSRELVKLIRKLRWIGLEEEADQMQLMLCRDHPTTILLAGPFETD